MKVSDTVLMRQGGWRWMLTLVDVGEDTTLGDCDVAEQLVQFLVVADGELEMTGDDTGLLVVTRGIAGQFEDLSGQIFEDGCEVDGRTWRI
jgi:hypothetical protein